MIYHLTVCCYDWGMNDLPEFVPRTFTIPERLDTAVLTLIPLKPDHVKLDYAALMESKTMLRLWSGSPWPQDDFSLADNLADLEWHWQEHQERIAFTYTVLNQTQDRCLGCVYLKRSADLVDDAGDFETAVRFWATTPTLKDDLDLRLLRTLINWFEAAWPFKRVLFHTHTRNKRQLEIFAKANLQHQFTVEMSDRGGAHQFWGK